MATKVLLSFVFLTLVTSVYNLGLREEFTWTRISYVWPNSRGVRQSKYSGSRRTGDSFAFPGQTNGGSRGENNASNQNNQNSQDNQGGPGNIPYTFENNIPMGANVWKDKLFITVPRRRDGVPSTLNYVPLNSAQKHNVPLIPYPNWDINILRNGAENLQQFVSIYRVAVDACDRLWFVDTGLIEIPGNATRLKPTTLVVMDLKTDLILRTFPIPEDQLRPATTLASVTVDTTEKCDNAVAYLPDLGGYGLIVYSYPENRSWRLTHNYFFLEPRAGEFFISGHNFQWNDGIFSIALTDIKNDGYRDAYFHSMAGTHLYKVSTRILRNESLATRSYHENDFRIVGDKGENSQTSSSDIHKGLGVLFLGLVNINALGCLNLRSPINELSIVQKDDKKMIYPCDVKVYGDNVILLTNTMPEFLYGQLNYNEINFRVWIENVQKAIKGTKCTEAKRGGYY